MECERKIIFRAQRKEKETNLICISSADLAMVQQWPFITHCKAREAEAGEDEREREGQHQMRDGIRIGEEGDKSRRRGERKGGR